MKIEWRDVKHYEGITPQTKIGNMFGVCQQVVSEIKNEIARKGLFKEEK